jgi:hypothetical protein
VYPAAQAETSQGRIVQHFFKHAMPPEAESFQPEQRLGARLVPPGIGNRSDASDCTQAPPGRRLLPHERRATAVYFTPMNFAPAA